MARIDSILSLDQRDIESLWLAMYGRLSFTYPRPERCAQYLGLLEGATAAEYLAIQQGVAALGGELVLPPAHIRDGLLTLDQLGGVAGLIVADPHTAPPKSAALCLNSQRGRPLDVVAHLYDFFIRRGEVNGVRVACDDSTVMTWFAATGELPISVVHSGMRELDPEFRATLAAEGQAGTYRHVLRADMRCDVDARRPPRHDVLAAAIAAALEFVAA